MKLTTRSEYALLALVHLARQANGGYVTVEAIAAAQRIPPKFLELLMWTMKKARLVRSAKGQRGGYQLARPANKIMLAEVIRLFDGALAPTESVSTYFYESTPVEREKKLLRVFKGIRDHIARVLEHTSLADVA